MAWKPPPPTVLPVVTRWEEVPVFEDEVACLGYWCAHLLGPGLFETAGDYAAYAAADRSLATRLDMALIASIEAGKVDLLSRRTADELAWRLGVPDAETLLGDDAT